jgi:exodeoxyribonuclease V alpha subunit
VTDLLDAFAGAGVLAPADVHVARRLTALAGEDDPRHALAGALAVRGPRLGHVYVDLATVHETTVLEPEAGEDPPWPAPAAWIERVRASELVGGPLHLSGSALYLDRYWREERQIAADLIALRDRAAGEADADLLGRLFDDPRQRHAGETAARRRLTVLAGGPGTGKTTTVARIVALLLEHDPDLLVALAAPTGKAAARLVEAVQSEAAGLDVSEPTRERLRALDASTLHRLLGWRPGSHSRFRHDRGNRLPHDVVIVDETSMVSLSLMARLVEAVRPQARLVLVGDPGQLASIEAGAVLGDIVGTGDGPGIVTLDRVHRYGGAIAKAAEAIRRGDADGTLEALAGVGWTTDPEPVYERAVDAARAVAAAARADDARAAIDALAGFSPGASLSQPGSARPMSENSPSRCGARRSATNSWLEPVSRPASAMPTLPTSNGSGANWQRSGGKSGPPKPSPSGSPSCTTKPGTTRWISSPS